jgi:hypothetical protein
MSLNVDLLAIEALTLGGLAVALHASSHRYGLAPPFSCSSPGWWPFCTRWEPTRS